jgi:MFS family permease
MGINGVWSNIGMASAPFVAGLLNYLIGWRRGLMILGGVGFIIGVAGMLTPFSVPRGSEVKQVKKLASGTAIRLLVVFAVAVLFAGLMNRCFSVILPAYLELRLESMNQSIQELIARRFSGVRGNPAFQTLVANFSATCVYVLGIVGQIIGGRVADRYSLKWAYFTFFLSALPFILAAALFSNALIIPAAGMFVLFTFGMQPVENSLLAFLTPARWRSVSYGIKFAITFGVGAFAVKIVGAVQRSYGIDSVVFLVAGFLSMVVLSIAVFLLLSRGQQIRH